MQESTTRMQVPVMVEPAVLPQLAHVNIARLRYPADSPELREFAAAFHHVNALAEGAPGFVWRYPTDDGHISGAELLDDPLIIINLSVWDSYEHLHAFTYRSTHGHYLRRRGQWFTPMRPPTTALWWIQTGQRPTPADAIARLRLLRRYGPTAQTFTVRRRFDPDGRPEPRRQGGARSDGPLAPPPRQWAL